MQQPRQTGSSKRLLAKTTPNVICVVALWVSFLFFWGLEGRCWAILGSWGAIFEVPSANQFHEERSRIESSINQSSVPENVRIFAVSWPSGAILFQTAPPKKNQQKGSYIC